MDTPLRKSAKDITFLVIILLIQSLYPVLSFTLLLEPQAGHKLRIETNTYNLFIKMGTKFP